MGADRIQYQIKSQEDSSSKDEDFCKIEVKVPKPTLMSINESRIDDEDFEENDEKDKLIEN